MAVSIKLKYQILQYLPELIKHAETRYAEVWLSRLRLDANAMGGAMIPASIASECCNPLATARTNGNSASRA